MGLASRTEDKFGKFAITGLIPVIGGLQVLVLVLQFVSPNLVNALILDVPQILRGEVWRCFTFVLVVGSPQQWLWTVFGILFFVSIGGLVEPVWGAWRLNLFFFGMLAITNVLGIGSHLLSQTQNSGFLMQLQFATIGIGAWAITSAIVMSAACEFPDRTVNLMGVIPIKLKWIGLLAFGNLLVLTVRLGTYTGGLLGMIAFLLAVLFPFLMIYGPVASRYLKTRAEVTQRRSRFEKAQAELGDSLYRCEQCGVTDTSDPDLEFRVTADGRDLCERCLPKDSGK